jgi:hypothetical protein
MNSGATLETELLTSGSERHSEIKARKTAKSLTAEGISLGDHTLKLDAHMILLLSCQPIG